MCANCQAHNSGLGSEHCFECVCCRPMNDTASPWAVLLCALALTACVTYLLVQGIRTIIF